MNLKRKGTIDIDYSFDKYIISGHDIQCINDITSRNVYRKFIDIVAEKSVAQVRIEEMYDEYKWSDEHTLPY